MSGGSYERLLKRIYDSIMDPDSFCFCFSSLFPIFLLPIIIKRWLYLHHCFQDPGRGREGQPRRPKLTAAALCLKCLPHNYFTDPNCFQHCNQYKNHFHQPQNSSYTSPSSSLLLALLQATTDLGISLKGQHCTQF